ncbi:MAG: XdhC family protein [Hyphomonadaceae bacterium]
MNPPSSIPITPPGLAGELGVLAFAQKALEAGEGAALVTIVGLDGPFSRPLGAQLAVSGSGAFAGSISGGCLEAALAEEAKIAMADGVNRMLRYGAGSPYIDVRLPCGGGIDLHVDVHLDPATLRRAIELGRDRKPFALVYDLQAADAAAKLVEGAPGDHPNAFVRRFSPAMQLVLAGRGWEIVALTRLAHDAGAPVVVASHEQATLEFCAPYATELAPLQSPRDPPAFAYDADTALACLFHEHEWEAPILLAALRSPAFYVGALGSRTTHATRLDTLRAMGASEDELRALIGPIGVFAAHDPMAIAVSSLADITMRHRARGRGA